MYYKKHYVMELTEELYLKHYAVLYYVAYNIVKDKEAAKDIVHDTFMKVYKLKELTGKIELMLIVIARNEAIDYWNKSKKMVGLEFDMLDFDTMNDQSDRMYIETTLLRGMLELPTKEKEVFDLKYYGGVRHTDIAKLLNITREQANTRYKNAIYNLSQFLIEKGITNKHTTKTENHAKTRLLDTTTGKIVIGIKVAAAILGVCRQTLTARLQKNKEKRFKIIS